MGEREFPIRRVTNPDTDQPIERLKYIGPFFQQRFAQQQNPMNVFDDVIDYVSRNSKERNTAMFKRVFRNQRWVNGHQNINRCIGAVARSRRPPHRYAIREYNRFAWNSMVIYLRRNMTDNERFTRRRQDRIPALLVPRPLVQTHPNYC
jgi:hypothetical protein